MRFGTLCQVVAFLAVASAIPQESQPSSLIKEPEETTENDKSTSSSPTEDKVVIASNGIPNEISSKKLKDGEDNNFDPILDDLLFESLIGDDKIINENPEFPRNRNEKSDYTLSNSENPDESKVTPDFYEIRRQGDQIPETKEENSASRTQFDDSKQDTISDDLQVRFGDRKSKQRTTTLDGAPVLQLRQGGYERPYKNTRSRNRYASRQDSSEQTSRAQEPGGNSDNNEKPETRQVVPQVTYSSRLQGPQALGPQPVFNTGYEAPNRNTLAVHQVLPTTIPSRFFNNPAVFPDYTPPQFQAQFPPNNEVGVFSNFVRDPNNPASYQESQGNPFQTPQLLYQRNPELQTQSYVIEAPRNLQPQYQHNPFNAPRGFENGADNAKPNFPSYFSNPTPFQIPPNFYTTTPNGVGAFNNPPINFLSNYPNADNSLPPQLFRYPVMTDAQNNQQNPKDQQLDSEASQEENNSKTMVRETVYPRNRDDSTSVRFGTRLQAGDIYMRYPTDEAGYATPENLPPQNNSEEAKDNGQQTSSEQRNIQSADSSRNGLNSIRTTNQRINNSFGFPPELFRDVPLDFGYQRPQNQILSPDRNRGNPNFESRNFFSNPLETIPEDNYQFLNPDYQRRGHRESDGTPPCAKQSNASYCFEDREYPRNDILYSLNSNSFLADRLAGPEVQLDSINLVERNVTEVDQGEENYACSSDIKYGSPLRAKNVAGTWRIIVNVEGKFAQPVRMEMCKSLGDRCNYIASSIKTTCVQKYSVMRLLSWSPGTGIYSDQFKIPVACSCQILEESKT